MTPLRTIIGILHNIFAGRIIVTTHDVLLFRYAMVSWSCSLEGQLLLAAPLSRIVPCLLMSSEKYNALGST